MELRAAAQALQRRQAVIVVLVLWPQLDGAADRVGGVAVGVHLAEPLGRGQQARTGTVAFAAGEPLLSDCLGAAPPLQLRRQPPVVAAPPGPPGVVVDGLADEGVSKAPCWSTSTRKPRWIASSMPSAPPSEASSSRSHPSPAAAAISRVWRPAGDSRSVRSSTVSLTVSLMVSGSGRVSSGPSSAVPAAVSNRPAAASAAASSSMKNGIPWVRSYSDCASLFPSPAPSTWAASAVVSIGPSGSTVSSCRRGGGLERTLRSGCPRHLIAAIGTRTSTGAASSALSSCSSSSAVAASTHWRSSRNTTVGCRRAICEQVADRLEQGRLIGVGGRRPELGEDQREMLRQRPGTSQAVRDRTLVAALSRRAHRA